MAPTEFVFNFTSQRGLINILLSTSGIFQTFLFVYHYFRHDRTSKLPHAHEYAEMFAVIFFIGAIVLSELSVPWNHWMAIDMELEALHEYSLIIPWMGVLSAFVGNVLFVAIEYYLDRGIQGPLFLNDISIHKIEVNLNHLDSSSLSLVITGNEEKADLNNKLYWNDKPLITNGPYKCCRHPIYLIWAMWEFGFFLATGHWFEYISFTFFIFVEAMRIDIIDKSLLYKYQQEYVDYVLRTPAAFCCLCTHCCNVDLAYCTCCVCLECKRYTEYQGLTPKHDKTVYLRVGDNDRIQNIEE